MILVNYDRSNNRLTVEGHAGSGEPGRDLICASASILAYTLASFAANTAEVGHSDPERLEIRLDPGDTLVSCGAVPHLKPVITLVFDSICAGFELLARDYPDYIHYDIKSNTEKEIHHG